jgi:hypothetical protein
MLHFLRRIRRSLINSGSLKKYTLYAIGEILLVMIGILLALQVNNWNETRKQHLNDIKFLKNLQHEIVLDTAVFADKTIEYKSINQQLEQTLQFLSRPTSINQSERQIMIEAISNLEVLTPSYKNIERNDVKLADGTLDKIDNQLNQEYLHYIEKIKSNNDIISKLGESLQFVAQHDVFPNVDLDYFDGTKFHFDIEELKSNRLFKNAIHRSIRYRRVSINFMNSQKEQANELLTILNEELK